ncbi:MAG: hypothetical protein GC159_00850 [Phycisphaera sp.]|nr:hypothetical protein [Phycisphaera sp.]
MLFSTVARKLSFLVDGRLAERKRRRRSKCLPVFQELESRVLLSGTTLITEVDPTGSSRGYGADWFEVTNSGGSALDITGWRMDDGSSLFANSVALRGLTSIPAGQSAIFLEGDATGTTDAAVIAAFSMAWFGSATPPADVPIGVYGGSGVGLSSNGDAVNLYDAGGTLQANVSFAASKSGFTFDNTDGVDGAAVSQLSSVGTHGGFRSASGDEVGSPGIGNVGRLIISEASPWSSGDASYGADWFEVTNVGNAAVDITGWKYDDSSNAFASAVALNGVTSIAAGQSVVFIEGDATTVANFETAWFGGSVPAGFTIGTYSGSGIGLSTGGDGVNLFDASGNHITGISFGASTTGFTFDNAAGLEGVVSQLSAVPTHGALLAADGVETGSPGAIAVSTVNLANYVRVARYDLPEPTRTTPPDGVSLLAQEASSVTYNWDTDTLFVVGDGGTSIVQVSKTGELIDSMTLAAGGSPQGTEFYDTEGITYVGGGMFVMTEERDRQANMFTYVPGTTLNRSDVLTVKLGTSIGNIGLEGVTYDPATGGFIFVKETDPRSIFQTDIDFAGGAATNGSPTTVNSTDLFDPSLVNTLDFSDIFALSLLPSLAGQSVYDQLLIISQESGQVVQVDRSGTVLHTLTIVADVSDTLSVPDMTMEGVAMDRDGYLYIVNENGGNDADHPQLWVYAPATTANAAPTAIELTGAATSIPENTNTASAVKLASILVTDDGIGDNTLSLSGADAASFEIIGTALFLKAGTSLNATIKSSFSINIDVDDATVGGMPDATTPYTLTITAASGGSTNLAITEAAPWSSGNSPLGSDWFEVTNFGVDAVSLVGWTMDDNSNSFAVSVALNGITSIDPGESVIFIETGAPGDLAAQATAFIDLWFNGTAPAGLQIGSYSGSGVGLSTGGDSVNLFDNAGILQANISFPSVPAGTPYATFDNTAGLSNAEISGLSVVGVYGAFVALNDADEIGSPGTIGSGATPIINITATDDLAAEAGSDPGAFRITRSGSVVSSLTVNYTITTGAGQATPDDYTPTLTGSVMIGAGDAFVDITITPVDDMTAEGAEFLTLNLFDTGSYDVGVSGSATVTIEDDDAANQAPTGVVLTNTVTELSEATDTSSDVRVADIAVTDDGQGTNDLSVSGVDAAFFEIIGSSLYLKAGTSLSNAAKASYDVTVDVDDATVGANPDASANFTLMITPSVAPGAIVISEVAPWSSSNSPLGADWFEVTNASNATIDITGWKYDDNSNAYANAVALTGISSIAPGEAVIFIETTDLATTSAAFIDLWFGGSAPAGFQIGGYSGSGVGLSGNGDSVNLFDAAGNRVAGISFGAATTDPAAKSFDNHNGLGSTTLPLPTVSNLSEIGFFGAFTAANDATEIGSPGIGHVGRLIVSEVSPWSSGNSPYGADWFEVSNVGTEAVDITGWRYDDGSDDFTKSVALLGVTDIAPGQAVVFIEGDAATVSAFESAWFGDNVPIGFTIGAYTGSGIGLSTGGDAVNLFDSEGNKVTGVTFGSSTTGFTFDNTAGLSNTAISQLSVAGFNGAFLADDGTETGSPGTLIENDPAVAVADEASTDQDTPIQIDVLDNDSDPDGDPLSVASVTDPAHGAAVINNDGTVTYTPDGKFVGDDSFVYTLSDGAGGLDTATVTVHVSPNGQLIEFGADAPARKVFYVDPDGTRVAMTLVGATATATVQGDGIGVTTRRGKMYITATGGVYVRSLAITSTSANAMLAVKTRGGDGAINVHNFDITGRFGSINARRMNITGDLTIENGLSSLIVGDIHGGGQQSIMIGNDPTNPGRSLAFRAGVVVDASFNSDMPLSLVRVIAWYDVNSTPDVIAASVLNALESTGFSRRGSTGAFQADLLLSGDGSSDPALGLALIRGPLSDATWTIDNGARLLKLQRVSGVTLNGVPLVSLI